MKTKNNRPDETNPPARDLPDSDAPSDARLITCQSAAACRRRREPRVARTAFRWRIRTTNRTSRLSH
jgi:hypothetical protein